MEYPFTLPSPHRGEGGGEGRFPLVESLEGKREQGGWIDHLIVRESNAVYGND